ncbi:GNAT family N-acetyltransferase [Cellulosimicrobium cellulans]|uniref:GNAT family N-acetyltransferase n=1 Tax=Cellulosimicrobium cellulans TaxID=1710 RepID=UPI0020978D46|nr:GNAT family N-acetyltransferase [Cellulosimicrobium cellulans]MCO7271822.1 GNAT family N-acetyltransferase [Cellulosimicrobium cellulans]
MSAPAVTTATSAVPSSDLASPEVAASGARVGAAFAVRVRLGSGHADVSFGAVDPARDAALVHGWLAHPRSVFWQLGHLDVDGARAYLEDVAADPHQDAWLGRVDGAPAFLVETYDPARVTLADAPAAVALLEPGDVGMHLLVAPPAGPARSGFTSAVMGAVVRFCLDPAGRGARRVVVEPDVRNAAIAAKNAAAGFRVLRELELPGKTAHLAVATRADLDASPLGDGVDLAPHLRPDLADRAHRHLVAKAIAELTHERLLAPRAVVRPDAANGPGEYVLPVAEGSVEYRFVARRYALEHWVLDEASIRRIARAGHGAANRTAEAGDPAGAGGTGARRELPVDALDLVVELQPDLRIPDDLLATYLEEVSSTLASATAKLERYERTGGPSATDLLGASFQQVEAAMTEGHPGFVANNGRIGFGLAEYRAYAPENGGRVRLVWLAARREHTHLALGAGLDEASHYAGELSDDERAAFADRLAARGLEPADYLYLPVHPWQWEHRVPITFAADVARGDLVPVGQGADEYQPQQSIRTLFNLTRPGRHYVKVALAIQNMGFLRGLSPAYMRDTPAINDWVADLVAADPELGGRGFTVLRELASIGYTGDVYHRTATPSPHRKMLAALWRESPVPRTAPGERLATMAALLHRDPDGAAHATALVRASGLDPADWVRAYLDAYLRPLAHALLAHDLAFMPHGENLILVLRDHVVVRAVMKDLGEEIAVLGDAPLPPDVERVRAVVDDEEKALAIFTDVFDGVLRHLAAILAGDGVLPEDRFWRLVAECLDAHRADHPDLRSGVDLRAPRFAHSCLNRLQLRNTLQMVDLADQSASLLYAGTLANPAARDA